MVRNWAVPVSIDHTYWLEQLLCEGFETAEAAKASAEVTAETLQVTVGRSVTAGEPRDLGVALTSEQVEALRSYIVTYGIPAYNSYLPEELQNFRARMLEIAQMLEIA